LVEFGVATAQIIEFLPQLLDFLVLELLGVVLYGFLVSFEAVMTVANVEAYALVVFVFLGCLLQGFSQSLFFLV